MHMVRSLEIKQIFTFPLYYNAFVARNEVALSYANAPCTCKQEWGYKLFQIDSRLESIKFNYENALNTDYSGTQTILDEIIEIKNEI